MSEAPQGAALMAEVTRGGLVESRHYGSAAVCGAGGLVWAEGDVSAPIYPRSAIKPIQALSLIETGAADRFGLTAAHIALACASHGGEPRHVALVEAWLRGLGLDSGALECGAQWPMYETAALALARGGGQPSAVHNNCSGKHAGMLCAARHCGESLDGYVDGDHPVQRRWIEALGELSALDASALPRGVDGCSIPTLALPLEALAGAFARMARETGLGGVRGAAVRRVREAMAAEPFLIAGSGRACTRIIMATEGRVLVKIGAEGVFTAMVPEAGLGLALKIEDGAFRAAEVAVVAVLRRALGSHHAISIALAPLAELPVETRRGVQVGVTRPAGALSG